jgi:hypothetical protein
MERATAQEVQGNLALGGLDAHQAGLDREMQREQAKNILGFEQERFNYGKQQDLFNQKAIAEKVFQEATAASEQYNALIDGVLRMPADQQNAGMMQIEQMISPQARMMLEKDENGRWRPNSRVVEGYKMFYPPNPLVGLGSLPGTQPGQASPQAPPPALSNLTQPIGQSSGGGSMVDAASSIIRGLTQYGGVGALMQGINKWRNMGQAPQRTPISNLQYTVDQP